jgi:hypothetical protein
VADVDAGRLDFRHGVVSSGQLVDVSVETTRYVGEVDRVPPRCDRRVSEEATLLRSGQSLEPFHAAVIGRVHAR